MNKFILILGLLLLGCLPQSTQAQNLEAVNDTFTLVHGNGPLTRVLDVLANDIYTLEDVTLTVDPTNTIGQIEIYIDSIEVNTDSIVVLPAVKYSLSNVNIQEDSFDYILTDSMGGATQATAFITFLPDSTVCVEDCVWPGDTNLDQVANAWDILPIGVAYGSQGPPRNGPIMSLWDGFTADNWGSAFLSGTDYKHADCTGNGVIDADDVEVINQNYGQTHDKASSLSLFPDNAIYLDILNDSIAASDVVQVDIVLGNMDSPAEGIYGLAFSIAYDESLVSDSSVIEVDFSNTWLGGENDIISIAKDLGGIIEIGLSRIDQMDADGYGTLGTLTFIMEDILIGKSDALNFSLSIEEVLVISQSEEIIDIEAYGDQAAIVGVDYLGSLPDNALTIYPNPATDLLTLDWATEQFVQEVQLYNLLGQSIVKETIQSPINNKQVLELPNLRSGLYYLKVQTAEGWITKKLVIE